jgi:hypothetical protein
VPRPIKPTDNDYEPKQLLSKAELKRFNPKDQSHIAILEARQQDRERRLAQGEKLPERPDDRPTTRRFGPHGA